MVACGEHALLLRVCERVTFSRESDAKMYVIEIRMWILRDSQAVLCSRIAALPTASTLKHGWDREDPVATESLSRTALDPEGYKFVYTKHASNNYVLYKSDNISSRLFHFSSYSRMEFVQSPL